MHHTLAGVSEPRQPRKSITSSLPTFIAGQETPHLLKITYDAKDVRHGNAWHLQVSRSPHWQL
jgi:hypothetical protein